MKFSELRNIIDPVFRNESDPIALIQKSYTDCVKKIKIVQQAFRMRIDGGCGFDGFNHIHVLKSGNTTSEIAFKEVHAILDVSFSGSAENYPYSPKPALVGNLTDTTFESDLEFVTDEKFMWIGSDLVPLDREAAKIEMTGFPFPYFCRTVNGPNIEEHRYDIKWMIATYGEDNLIIDDLLGVMSAIKAKLFSLLRISAVSEASNIEYFYDQILNTYNDNLENFFVHGFESLSEQISRRL